MATSRHLITLGTLKINIKDVSSVIPDRGTKYD